MPRFKLVSLHGDFTLEPGEILAGSHHYCQVHLPYSGVMGEHARLDVGEQSVVLTPLTEQAVTLVSFRPVDGPTTLSPGDPVRLGRVNLRLRAVEGHGAANRRRPLWSRIWRWTRKPLLALILLFILLILTVRIFINGDSLKYHLQQEMQARLKRLVHIEECEVDYLRGEVSVRGLRVENRSGFRQTSLLSVAEARAELSILRTLLSSLDGEPNVDVDLRAYGVTVFLERNAAGDLNIEDLARQADPRRRPLNTEPQGEADPDRRDADEPIGIDLGLESLRLTVDVPEIQFLYRDEVNDSNLMTRGAFGLRVTSLDAPVTWHLDLGTAYGDQPETLTMHGSLRLFDGSRITPESIRGNLLTLSTRDLDLTVLGREFPEVAWCRVVALSTSVRADGLEDVRVSVQARGRDLLNKPLHPDVARPIEGLDVEASLELLVDAVNGDLTMAPEQPESVLRATYRPDDGAAPAELLRVEAHLNVADQGRERLDSDVVLHGDLAQITSPALMESFRMRVGLKGTSRFALHTQGNLRQGIRLRLESEVDGGVAQQAADFAARLDLDGRLSWSEAGKLQRISLDRAQGRTALIEDGQAQEVVRLSLKDGQPLFVEGLEQDGRAATAGGVVSVVVRGEPLRAWARDIFRKESFPAEDLEFDLSAAPRQNPGEFSLLPSVRLHPHGSQQSLVPDLLIEGRADFNVAARSLQAALAIRDPKREVIDQALMVAIPDWSQPAEAFSLSTRPRQPPADGEALPIDIDRVMALLSHYRLLPPLKMSVHGEALLDATIERQPDHILLLSAGGSMPWVQLAGTGAAAPGDAVQFSVSTGRVQATMSERMGAWSLEICRIRSSLLDLDAAGVLQQPSTYSGDAAVDLNVKDLAGLVRALDWADLVNLDHEALRGSLALKLEAESTSKQLSVHLRRLDLHSTAADLELDVPTDGEVRLTAAPVADLLHPVDPLPWNWRGQARLAGRSRDLAALGRVLGQVGLDVPVDATGSADRLQLTAELDAWQHHLRLALTPAERSSVDYLLRPDRRLRADGPLDARIVLQNDPWRVRLDSLKAGVQGGELTLPEGATRFRVGGRVALGRLPEPAAQAVGVDINRHLSETWGCSDCAYGRATARAALWRDRSDRWQGTVIVDAGNVTLTPRGLRVLPVFCLVRAVDEWVLTAPAMKEILPDGLPILDTEGQLVLDPAWRVELHAGDGRVRFDRFRAEGANGIGIKVAGTVDGQGLMDLQVTLTDSHILAETPATRRRDAIRGAMEGRRFAFKGTVDDVSQLQPVLTELLNRAIADAKLEAEPSAP